MTLTNGIGHLSVPAGTHSHYDIYYYKISDFRPSTKYRLKFTAWGNGKIQSFVYPGAVLSENGSVGDGQKTWTLNATPAQYSYEFDSLSNLYGDAQKTIMFRIPASDQAVDFYLDTNSVTLEKVGGVANAIDLPYINLIKRSSPTQSTFISGTTTDDKWTILSGGIGKGSLVDLPDTFKARHGLAITGNLIDTNRDFGIKVPLEANTGKYTLSVKIKLVPDTQGSAIPLMRIGDNRKLLWIGFGDRAKTNEWSTQSWVIDTTGWPTLSAATLQIGINGAGSIYLAEPQLEKGTVAHDYMPSPADDSLDWR